LGRYKAPTIMDGLSPFILIHFLSTSSHPTTETHFTYFIYLFGSSSLSLRLISFIHLLISFFLFLQLLSSLIFPYPGKSSDICTSLSYNFHDNFVFLSYDWSKTIEREKWKENKNIMWLWERKLLENGCTNIISPWLIYIFI